MNTNKVRPLKKDEEIDIKKILNRFLIQWKFYLISFFVIVLLAFLFIKYSTPLYKVHAQVLVEDNDNK
ncbi:MAG TPA: Wzz/FepE/Etk N-terminal domain-containing protein, partial [Parafilimonas sp.]